jgi:hypothetical protein
MRYLIKLHKTGLSTYKTAELMKREYELTNVSVTTEPGYFFASCNEDLIECFWSDKRIRQIEIVE